MCPSSKPLRWYRRKRKTRRWCNQLRRRLWSRRFRLLSHRRLHGYAPQLRIGIHVGEVSDSGSAVRGAAVHRAARLCEAAGPDEIIASREALESSGRPLTGLKKMALKGMKDLVEAAEVSWQA